MTLKEYLSLIIDDEVRIELELDIEEEDEYTYKTLWLSDFRNGAPHEYSEWTVEGVSFIPIKSVAEISIRIKH